MGGFHTMAVTDAGVAAWGCNDTGQLGTGDRADRRQPAGVAALAGKDVTAVACGASHTLFLCRCRLSSDFKRPETCVWQLLQAPNSSHLKTPKVMQPAYHQVDTAVHTVHIVCTLVSIALVCRDGSVLGCGLNDNGQLPLGLPQRQLSSAAQQPQLQPAGSADGGIGASGNAATAVQAGSTAVLTPQPLHLPFLQVGCITPPLPSS